MTRLESLEAARAAVREGATAEDLLREAAGRNRQLDAGDEPVRAFLSTVDPAGASEATRGEAPENGPGEPSGEPPPGEGALAGVPVAVKDNICTTGLPTSCGSRMLEGYRSPYAATAVRRLTAAGARVFGKTNMDEFAMGSSTENSAFGPTRNPVDRSRVPGGSSGGSAAAVAAGVVPAALGSDTGGSVRQPAAFCGVVGVKPTYGRVSRYGLVAFASSLDQIGVIARSVGDAARVLEVVAGHDPRDATSRDVPVPRPDSVERVPLDGQAVGVPEEYLGEGLDPGVRRRIEEALGLLEEGGAEVRRVSLPSTPAAIPCYYLLAPAEASSNLARFDGVRYGRRAAGADSVEELHRRTRSEGFGPEVKRRIMLGTYALSAGYYEEYYLGARDVQRRISREYRGVFEEGVDALFTPTTPTPAFRLGHKVDDPYAMYLSDVYTVSANLAGLPAVSVPVGTADGLPVGGQLMCAPWEEEKMLGIARRLEERAEYRPPRPAADRGGSAAGGGGDGGAGGPEGGTGR